MQEIYGKTKIWIFKLYSYIALEISNSSLKITNLKYTKTAA